MQAFRDWVEDQDSQANAGELLGVTQKTISKWMLYGITLNRIRHVERVTGISAGELCPEHFGPQFE